MHATSKLPLDDACALRESLHALAIESDVTVFVELMVTILVKMSGDHQAVLLRLKKMLHSKYSRNSEKLCSDQLALAFEALKAFDQSQDNAPEPPGQDSPASNSPTSDDAPNGTNNKPKKKKPKGHGRGVFPSHLKREENLIFVPQAERQCRVCGAEKICIGHAASERIDYRPASLFVTRDMREKMACKPCQGEVSIAPVADHIVEGGIVGEGLLAHVIVSKFVDGLPLTRISNIYKREKVHLAASTLGDIVGQCAKQLTNLAGYIAERVLASPYINQDDSGLRVLDRDHPNGIKRGHVWAYVHKKDVVYKFTPDWCGEHPRNFLRGYGGIIQGDGYSGIDRLFTGEHDAPIRAGCLMHCRRYFHEAHKAGESLASVPLALIHEVYRIEAEAKQRALSPEERLILRREQSVPFMKKLADFVQSAKLKVAPKSYLGKALTYASNQWPALMVPFSHGQIEVDNGEAERRLKVLAMGRRSWLFAGSDRGGERAAVLLTVLGTAVNYGVNPLVYVTDVFKQIAGGIAKSRIGELHPAVWAEKRGEQLTAQQIPIPKLVV